MFPLFDPNHFQNIRPKFFSKYGGSIYHGSINADEWRNAVVYGWTGALDGSARRAQRGVRGFCWGSWSSEASPSSGHADDFGPHTASVSQRNLRGTGVNKNANTAQITWGLLCRDGPTWRRLPPVPKARMAALRRRRFERTRSAARRPGTSHPGPAAARARCPEGSNASRAGSLLRRRRCSGPGHVAAADV
jgi:hypothetical protein